MIITLNSNNKLTFRTTELYEYARDKSQINYMRDMYLLNDVLCFCYILLLKTIKNIGCYLFNVSYSKSITFHLQHCNKPVTFNILVVKLAQKFNRKNNTPAGKLLILINIAKIPTRRAESRS